jgi:hypothetical protein
MYSFNVLDIRIRKEMEKVRMKYSSEFKKVRDKDKTAMFPTEFQRVL